MLLCLVTFAIGTLTSEPWLVLAFVLMGILFYHLYNHSEVIDWLELEDKMKNPPESSGTWGRIFDGLYELQKANQSEKERLEHSLNYLERSFSAMPDGVVILDRQWCIDWSNAAAQDYLRINSDRDIGQLIFNLIRKSEFIAYIEAYNFNESFFMTSPCNEAVILEIRLTSFGEFEHILFARDVTKIRQLDQMRKDFTDNVSHELRTPLTVITGYLESFNLRKDLIDPKLHKAVDNMTVQGNRMKDLITDIIMLSRLESVPVENDACSINVEMLCQQIVDDCAALISPERPIEMDIDTTMQLRGARSEIYSAFSNLFLNALKYTPDDSLIIFRWQKTTFGAIFSVKDSGPGIPIEHLSRLTERFYRVDNSRATNLGGTGLGLAIVKHILQRHGGTIRIASMVGHGSTFTCNFPNARIQHDIHDEVVNA